LAQRKARQTFERRQLGLTLRRLRVQAGTTQQAAADVIGKSRPRIVELEEGRGTLNQEELGKLLDCYTVSGAERATVLALGVEARKRQRGRVHTDLLPDSFGRFADLEATATEISNYEPSIMPGLLQSPGYVRAAMENGDGIWWTSSTTEREERIAFRIQRQVRIWDSAEPRNIHFVVTEEVLRGAVGSAQVRHEQLRHILRVLEEHSDVAFQVLPIDMFENPARGGGFALFRFGDKGSPVGFSSWVFGPSTYFDQAADTAILQGAFDKVRELALSPEKSKQLVSKIAREI
jgi:transcriptional regulator with XRE-family HTH domain